MTSDDRSPIERLEARQTPRGATSMIDTVHTRLARRRGRRIAFGLVMLVAVAIGAATLLYESGDADVVLVEGGQAGSSVPLVSQQVDTPDLTGLQLEEAKSTLVELGLVAVWDFRRNETVPVNEVFEQSPAAGARVDLGSEVNLVVSAGEASSMPAVISLTQDEARALLAGAGYTVIIEARSDVAAVGLVIEQIPAPGAVVEPGQSVTIVVSTGPDQVVVPDVEGMSFVQAFNRLVEAGFRIEDDPMAEPSDTIPEGRVTRTDPRADSLVAPGSLVEVTISSGAATVAVPTVIGLFYDTAAATLRTVGLEPIPQVESVPFQDPRVGVVVAQTPAPFTELPIGSQIVLTVGEAAPPASTTP